MQQINFIQFLRFFAVIFVYSSHVLISFWRDNIQKQNNFHIIPIDFHSDVFFKITSAIPDFLNFGPLGVAIFFLISGFLFGLTLESKEGITHQFSKKIIRIFPVYWFSLCIYCTAAIFFSYPDVKFSAMEAAINFTGIPNTFGTNYIMGLNWYVEAILYFFLFAIIFNKIFSLTKFENMVFFISCLLIVRANLFYSYFIYILLGVNFANFHCKKYSVKPFAILCLLGLSCFYLLTAKIDKENYHTIISNYFIAFILFCLCYACREKKWINKFAARKSVF